MHFNIGLTKFKSSQIEISEYWESLALDILEDVGFDSTDSKSLPKFKS